MGYFKTILDLLMAIFSAIPVLMKYFTKTPQEKADEIAEDKKKQEQSDAKKGEQMGEEGRDPGL